MIVRQVALIACSNGLGHTWRLLVLSKALRARDWHVTLLAPAAAVRRMADAGLNLGRGVEVVDFSTETTAARVRSNDPTAVDWPTRLPELADFDVVVSDNLPEILEIRPDCVLSGHFLWHLALTEVASEYFRRCEALLTSRRPRMIATGLFVSGPLAERVELHRVGLFGTRRNRTAPKRDVLVSCGTGGQAVEQTRVFTETLARRQHAPFRRIHLDPLLVPDGTPSWIVPADYSVGMYDSVEAIVCRPGTGTVTEGLLSGARIFCFYEMGNLEMASIAANLDAAGVGENCGDPMSAWKKAVAFAKSSDAKTRHGAVVNRVEADGHIAAADLLTSW